MDLLDAYHAAKAAIVAASGGSDLLLHTHLGLAIYAASLVAFRTRRGSVKALQIVLAAELLNEAIDRMWAGAWNWPDTAGDIAATLLWPTVLCAISLYRRARWTTNRAARPRPIALEDQADYARLPVFAGAAAPVPPRRRAA